jgi:hypothetical protein
MHPRLRFFGIAITVVMIAACWRWAYEAARQFSPITVVVALGISLAFLFSIRMMMASTNVTPRGKFTATGTLLQPDIRIDRNLHRLVVIGAVSTVLCFFAWWPLGVLYLPLFHGDGSHIVPVCAGGAAVPLLWIWWRHRMLGSLTLLMLTPEGFKFPTIASMHQGRWDDVAAVDGKSPSGEQFWNPMIFTMNDDSTLVFEAPGTYTPRGTALVELVRFYWQNPEQRDELTDGRAVRRLNRLLDEKASEQR